MLKGGVEILELKLGAYNDAGIWTHQGFSTIQCMGLFLIQGFHLRCSHSLHRTKCHLGVYVNKGGAGCSYLGVSVSHGGFRNAGGCERWGGQRNSSFVGFLVQAGGYKQAVVVFR